MKGTKRTRRPRLTYITDKKVKKVASQLVLPRELHNWLVDFAIRKGFNSEMEGVREFVRERRDMDAQATT